MITAIIRNKENTLVLELPHSIYDIYEKLRSIGIMQPPKQIPLTDNEDEDIGVKLFSESDFGQHLLLTLNEKNTIADANMLTLVIGAASEDIKEELEQNILYDQYDSMDEVINAVRQMTQDAGPVKAVFFCPLVGNIDEGDGDMIRKVQANREYLLGTLIRQLEELQYRTTGGQQRIKEIDREIADLTAQNLVLSRLHGKGVLNAADYTAQSDVLENKITELRIERRAKITDSDENEMLDELKMLNDILKGVEIGIGFDAELFEQTVDSITVDSNELLTFHLAGGISLPEKIREKGRCYQA